MTDVKNVIAHLKDSEGLFYDDFIHGTHCFHALLSLLFTSLLYHEFSPSL